MLKSYPFSSSQLKHVPSRSSQMAWSRQGNSHVGRIHHTDPHLIMEERARGSLFFLGSSWLCVAILCNITCKQGALGRGLSCLGSNSALTGEFFLNFQQQLSYHLLPIPCCCQEKDSSKTGITACSLIPLHIY